MSPSIPGKANQADSAKEARRLFRAVQTFEGRAVMIMDCMREDRGSPARPWEIIVDRLELMRAVMIMRLNGIAKNFVG
ncbi:MAG: hypothetical protein Q9177_002114 [Variospora cf. flavescens]